MTVDIEQTKTSSSDQVVKFVPTETEMHGEVIGKLASAITKAHEKRNNLANGNNILGDKGNIYTISNGCGCNEEIMTCCANSNNIDNSAGAQNVVGDYEETACKRFLCGQNGPNNVAILLAEFVGTGLLLFIGCMGCITNYEVMALPHYMPALTFGLTVMMIIQMFGHISGAHLNPAVTMITVLNGMIELKSLPFYVLGQFAGAICGLGGLKLLIPEDYYAQDFFDATLNTTVHKQGLCTTNIHPGISSLQAMMIEVVITFVLIFVCCSIWDKRNATKQDSVPLRFGFVISAIGIAAGPFSGGSMNTARSFAPALLNNDWDNQWVYWVGPTCGALISYYLYKYVYEVTADAKDDEYDEVSLKNVNSNDVKA